MDSKSLEILSKVHPRQRELVTRLIETMISLGYDMRVTQGLRTAAEQEALYAQGRSKPGKRVTSARAWQSNHNYGFANDITNFKNGKPDWNDLKPYQILGREAKKLGLEWGGDWKAVDMPHVQLRGMSVKECQTAYKNGGLQAVWNRMNQILSGAKPIVFIPKEDELLEFGDKGAAVERLQKDLFGLGFLRAHEVDGHFGKVTKNAVIGFQRQNGLSADGIVGPGTKAKLLAALDSKKTLNSISAVVPALKDSPSIPIDPPAVVANVSGHEIPQNDLPAEPPPNQATEQTNIESPQGKTEIVEQKNEQDVSQPAQVPEPPPQGIFAKLTGGVSALFSGTIIYTVVERFSGYTFSQTALILICLVVVLAFLGFLFWAALDAWKQNNRIKLEVEAKTDKNRKDLEWV